MFEWIYQPEAWLALISLVALEIVLGIDNIIFISILVSKLPEHQRNIARRIGLILAAGTRILLLFSLVWMMSLTHPLFSFWNNQISGRDLILIFGGLFLIVKSIHEIYGSFEIEDKKIIKTYANNFFSIIIQIAIIDIVFSLDSVITAVGLVSHTSIMVIAILIAVCVMLFAAKPIGEFIDRYPTIKMLALAFLILIGFILVLEGFDLKISKAYIYFAMGFSVAVEFINIKLRFFLDKKS